MDIQILAVAVSAVSAITSSSALVLVRGKIRHDKQARLGESVHISETGSQEEIGKWVADHDGTTEVPAEERLEMERKLRKDV